MGRPKLPRTKEQIAIRLTPGTKARLAELLRALAAKGAQPIRSEVLRRAIERGLEVLEAEVEGRSLPQLATAPAPSLPVSSQRVPERTAPARPAPPPPRMPVPASSRSASSAKRSPIPGTLADRAWQRLLDQCRGDRSAEVSIPLLCKAAWPPNPARVRDALLELVELGLVELVPAGENAAGGSSEELYLRTPHGSFGQVRLR